MYSSTHLPTAFTHLVSDATAHLPPLTRPIDEDLLRAALTDVVEMFWKEYLTGLPQSAIIEYQAAFKDESGKQLAKWYETYAHFTNDELAQKKADAILQDIATRLPEKLINMYQESV